MRLAVVSPFLDRQHGTELCILEQVERFAHQERWQIALYAQRVEQLDSVCSVLAPGSDSPGSILWRKIPDIPGPHLLKYFWWFVANQWMRRRDRRSGNLRPDLVYSPGINCLDADVIVVHIVFQEFYARVKSQLALRRLPLASWLRVIHRKLYYKLAMFLERRIYTNPRVRLIAVSSHVAAQLKAHFARADVTVIPNAVDTNRFAPAVCRQRRSEARQTLQFTEKDFVLLLIGNDWKNKGLDCLLHALAHLKDLPLHLLVVGTDDPALYGSMIEELRLQTHVGFEKPALDVLRFYAAADLYVAPSLEDAFNLPVLEAMACGLPVIASVRAGASELIQDSETGVLLRNPTDPLLLAQLVRRLFEDAPLRQRVGDGACCHAQLNCTWDQNALKTRDLLLSIQPQSGLK